MIDINSVMFLDVLNYDNWNTINDRETIDLGSDKNSYIILSEWKYYWLKINFDAIINHYVLSFVE